MTKPPATRPNGIGFRCEAVSGEYRHFTRRFLALVGEAGLPAPVGWRNLSTRDGDPARIEAAVDGLPASPDEAGEGAIYLQVHLDGGITASTEFHPRWGDSALGVAELRRVTAQNDGVEVLVEFQQRCQRICRDLLREFHLYSAELRPFDGGAACIPDVPLVALNSHIVVANEEEADELYDEPAAFWNAGWTRVEERGGQRLLARDLDVVAGAEYLSRIIGPQWAMARAAKPKETKYDKPYVTLEEEPIFRAGDKTLHFIGYDPVQKTVEYSCALTRGAHVHGWEVFSLFDILTAGKASDGSPVETVRIIFLDEWAAFEEKRPLLDIGCRVFHFDDEGELRELTE